jgi:5'-nucleotidase
MALVVPAVALAACGSQAASSPSTSTTSTSSRILHVLVTNDDGVGAPGIDAAVQALRSLPHTQVAVVAPLTNQSGTGGQTTPGPLTVTAATTASGYPAQAVHGYPADTITWGITDHGIDTVPDLVVSGINFGENVGPLANGSGTVGAAKAGLALGIPALAVSQGVDDGAGPDFGQSAKQLPSSTTAAARSSPRGT